MRQDKPKQTIRIQGNTRQYKTIQDDTRPIDTIYDNIRQDKARQDKTI